jgi:hypothetical protein
MKLNNMFGPAAGWLCPNQWEHQYLGHALLCIASHRALISSNHGILLGRRRLQDVPSLTRMKLVRLPVPHHIKRASGAVTAAFLRTCEWLLALVLKQVGPEMRHLREPQVAACPVAAEWLHFRVRDHMARDMTRGQCPVLASRMWAPVRLVTDVPGFMGPQVARVKCAVITPLHRALEGFLLAGGGGS